jgi:hypothetical protein
MSEKNSDPKILFIFVLLQIALQLLLLTGLEKFRVILRMGTFASSIAFIALILIKDKYSKPLPSIKLVLPVISVLIISLFYPSTQSILAGVMSIALYIGILSPILWIPRVNLDMNDFKKLIVILLIFNTLGSIFGILQVRYPGRFQPKVASMIDQETLQITTAKGELTLRPMGLTDTPGGVSGQGIFAALFGLGIILVSKNKVIKLLCFFAMIIGLGSAYLSHVRMVIVALAISLLALLGALAWRHRASKLVKVLGIAILVGFIAFSVALRTGGSGFSDRLSTLTSKASNDVYYENRGKFLESTIQLMPKYPFGVGLGLWGMVNAYFGNGTTSNFWAEIQWTAWLYDGGILLILLYSLMLFITMFVCFHRTRFRSLDTNDLTNTMGFIILAYDFGVLAMLFNCIPFIGQPGLQFWLLNSAYYAATQSEEIKQPSYSVEDQT